MVSGLAAWPTAGAVMNPLPRSSEAVIVYGLAVPVFSPLGVVRLHWNSRLLVFHGHTADWGLIAGPASVALTLPAAASAAAVLAAIGRPALSVSTNLTGIVDPRCSVLLGSGEVNPPIP